MINTRTRAGQEQTNKQTNKHPFNGPFSGTTQVSQYQKGKTNLDCFLGQPRSVKRVDQIYFLNNCRQEQGYMGVYHLSSQL